MGKTGWVSWLVGAGLLGAGCGSEPDADTGGGSTTSDSGTTTSPSGSPSTTPPTTPPTTTDTGPVDPTTSTTTASLLQNPSFEAGWDGSWLVDPVDATNFGVIETGDPIAPGGGAFTADHGAYALQIWGQDTGSFNRTLVYQEIAVTPGQYVQLSGRVLPSSDDPILELRTYGFIGLVWVDDYGANLGSAAAAAISPYEPRDQWYDMLVWGTAPTGATRVRAGVQFEQCLGAPAGSCFDEGSLFFDQLSMW